jgi:polar amino acid transport system substrate-binding protein
VAFLPVDAERKTKVDFGSAHIVLQSTYLVAPGSAIAVLADVDKPGVRVAGVGGTATARAAQASLKTAPITLVKTAGELLDRLKSGRVDAIALSRESLRGLAARLPGSRVLDEAFLNSYVAVAVPKGKPAALAYASAFIDAAIGSGSVRRALDRIGMQASTVPPPGTRP